MADSAGAAWAAKESHPHHHKQDSFAALALGAIGVVFGDIGTSPLYAMKEALHHSRSGGASELAVLGVVSLVLWALVLIVTIKYVVFLMRADNKGEGGTLALMALAQRYLPKRSTAVFFLGVIGAALFYGDGIITPAISVLSAVEGLEVGAPALHPFVIPITLVVLFWLLAIRDWTGSEVVGKIAGWEGIICGLSAIYGAAAQILNEVYGKVILPLGPYRK